MIITALEHAVQRADWIRPMGKVDHKGSQMLGKPANHRSAHPAVKQMLETKGEREVLMEGVCGQHSHA